MHYQDIVNEICDDEDIKAISFVGSTNVSWILSIFHTMPCILLMLQFRSGV